MNPLDFLFYTLFPRPKHSAPNVLYGSRQQLALLLSLWVTWLIAGIFLAFSLFYRNKLADLFVNSPWPIIILAFIVGGLMILRYCLFISYESLVVKRQEMRHVWIYYIINWLIIIGAPVLIYVAFRLYLYGHVHL